MAEYILFMHDDADDDPRAWDLYLRTLEQSGAFDGGNAIRHGICLRENGSAPGITEHLTGYIRLTADSIDHAKSFLAGNPVFEAGGTVEIRELPRT